MKLLAQIGSDIVVVYCDADANISSLASVAVQKFKRLYTHNDRSQLLHVVEIRTSHGDEILDPEDRIGDHLKEEETVRLIIEAETHHHQYQHHNNHLNGPSAEDIKDLHNNVTVKEGSKSYTILTLDGNSLTTEQLYKCSKGLYKLKLSHESEKRINASRDLLEDILRENKVVYGITTGFGNFAQVTIPPAKIVELQENLIRSHACGVGLPLSTERVLMVLALRINILAKGYSGISLEVVHQLIDAFNASCASYVPQKGTVGCSGDLVPLAHLALGLSGEGKMWSPITGWGDAASVLAANNLRPLRLRSKEGLALINGTQMVSALGAEALCRAKAIARQADVVSALTLEVLKGTTTAYDARIHELRAHPGQNEVAKRLRLLLHSDSNPSEIAESHRNCGRVQDCYTLRCVPQVHGIVHETIAFVEKVLTVELNSATDNPLVFCEAEEILSGGNFHGEYPAKVLDYLAIGIHEMAQISERRLERLVNAALSGLPPFLTLDGGINSGFMMIQVVAASLVSENKVLCHPSSVDSIPTSAGQEDHVSMGGFAARKVLQIVEHVEQVVAMELLAACQALEFLKPLKSTEPLQKVYELVRSVSPAVERDRVMSNDIETVATLLRDEKIWACVEAYLDGRKDVVYQPHSVEHICIAETI